MLYSCSTKATSDTCTAAGNTCDLYIDGYYFGGELCGHTPHDYETSPIIIYTVYFAVALCTIVGLCWYKLLFSKIKFIQKIPRKDWHVINK